jgi:hypothetical protein
MTSLLQFASCRHAARESRNRSNTFLQPKPSRSRGAGQDGVSVIWNTWFDAPVARKVLPDVFDTVE